MRIGKQKNEKQKVGLREAVNEFMSSFINFLKRNKLYSAVNLLGLSLSMAFVLLLAVYVTSQLSTDSFQKNADRIYVIAQKETVTSAYWMSRHMKANFPEIEKSASYSTNGLQEYKIDGNIVNARTSYADSSFFDMFSFPLVEGDFREWKASISGVLISESFAKAQFGDRDPVGREIRFDGADSTVSTLTVSGVFKDIENSIIRPCDIFLRGEIMTITNQANDERMSNAGSSTCFVMAYPNADLPARHDDILKWCRENFWRYMSDYGGGDNDVRIIPLRDVYFLSDGNEDYNDSDAACRNVLPAASVRHPELCEYDHGSLRLPCQGDGHQKAHRGDKRRHIHEDDCREHHNLRGRYGHRRPAWRGHFPGGFEGVEL